MMIINISRHRKKKYLIAAILLLLTTLFPLSLIAQMKTDSIAYAFNLLDIQGNRFDLTEHLGKKLTVIIFWATWGHDSSEMLNDVEHLFNKYRDQGFSAVGVCVEQQIFADSIKKKIIDTVKNKGITFPILLDDQLRTFRRYGVIAVPTTIAIDTNRKVLYHLSGYPIIGREEFYGFVQEMFEGRKNIIVHKKFDREPNKKALRLYNMAELKLAKGQLDTAKKYATESASEDSLFLQPLLLLTEVAIEENDLKSASINIEQALRLAPQSVLATTISGLVLAKNDKTEDAIKLLENIIGKDDTLAIAHCYLGYSLGRAGSFEKAISEFAKAETLSPAEYQIPLLRSEIYEKAGKQNEAMNDRIKSKRLRREK